MLCADRDAGTGALGSAVGIRDLAATLGISKDAAARGLGRLIQAGLVRRKAGRDDGGRFGRRWYVLSLPVGLVCEGSEPLIEPTSAEIFRASGRGRSKRLAPTR